MAKYMPIWACSWKFFKLLDLPPELLMQIALALHAMYQGPTSHSVTLFSHYDSALFALSSVNRKLRDICIDVGLYRSVNVGPNIKQLKLSTLMGHSLFRQIDGTLRSLVIHLEHEEAWPL